MTLRLKALILITILFPMNTIHCLRVLVIFHRPALSHFFTGDALMKGLIEAGHHVTAISLFPLSANVTNFRHININTGELRIDKNYLDVYELNVFEYLVGFYKEGIEKTEATLNHPSVQRLLAAKDEHFDIVITHIFANEAFLGFGHHFKAPVIGVGTFGTMKWLNDLVGTPSPLSYVPHTSLPFTDTMGFRQRLVNTIVTLFEHLYMEFIYLPQQYKIYDKVFDNPKPSLEVLRKNVSLILINTHFSIGFPRPYMPNMIEIGGIQIKSQNSPLPTDVKDVLDGATNGAIYFSMGSHLKSSLLPNEKKMSILKVFAKLKQTVLWKWEDTNLSGKPDNVFVKNWFPQNDILAHPNVKCFLSHGGLLSITEAVYHGVPIIGIPVFADQHFNMAKAQEQGYAVLLSYSNLTEHSLEWALMEVLKNSRYSEQAKTISARYRDRPISPLKTAIYWIEYVAKHKGAPHLKSAAMQLNWLSYHNIDVFICFTIVAAIFLGISIKILGLCKVLLENLFHGKRIVNARPIKTD